MIYDLIKFIEILVFTLFKYAIPLKLELIVPFKILHWFYRLENCHLGIDALNLYRSAKVSGDGDWGDEQPGSGVTEAQII